MATQFYRDKDGNYLGGFDGVKPPDGAIEVFKPPVDARYKWNGNEWIIPEDLKPIVVDEKREEQVFNSGVTLEDKVNALFELARGNSVPFDQINAIVTKAEQDIPKPK